MIIDISPESLSISGALFNAGVRGSSYTKVVGDPDRVVAIGPPAPVGHRNNHVWFYDELGVFLAEHHLSRLIEGVGIVFEPDHAYRQIRAAFTGDLTVCGVKVVRGMRPQEFLDRCTIPFRWHLGHSLVYDAERLSIDIDTYCQRTKSGRNSQKRFVSVVSVGFAGAHLPVDN